MDQQATFDGCVGASNHIYYCVHANTLSLWTSKNIPQKNRIKEFPCKWHDTTLYHPSTWRVSRSCYEFCGGSETCWLSLSQYLDGLACNSSFFLGFTDLSNDDIITNGYIGRRKKRPSHTSATGFRDASVFERQGVVLGLAVIECDWVGLVLKSALWDHEGLDVHGNR